MNNKIQTIILLFLYFVLIKTDPFVLTLVDPTINAITTYTLNITRTGTTPLKNFTLIFPNIFSFTQINYTINNQSNNASFTNGILSFTNLSTQLSNSSVFNIQLINVVNPGFSYNFNSNLSCTFYDTSNNSEYIIYNGWSFIEPSNFQSCNFYFLNYVNTVGTLTVTLIISNPIPASSNNYINIQYSTYWANLPSNTATQKGLTVTGSSLLNSITLTSIVPTNVSLMLSNITSSEIIIIMSNPLLSIGTNITFVLNNINTPPTQITSTSTDQFTVTTSTTLGIIDQILACPISNTPVYVLTGNLLGTGSINSNFYINMTLISNGNNQIWITYDQLIISYPASINFSSVNYVVIQGSSNVINTTLTNTSGSTQTFGFIMLNPRSNTITKANQTFNLSFGSAIVLPSSAKPVTLSISYSRKSNNYYMQTNVSISATPGKLSNLSINFNPNTVGSNSTCTLSFSNQDPISSTGGIIVTFPSTVKINNSTSVIVTITNVSISSSISYSIQNNQIIISNMLISALTINNIINIQIKNVQNGISTAPVSNFNITTYDVISDLTTMIDTDASLVYKFTVNTISIPIVVSSSSRSASAISNYTIQYNNGVTLASGTTIVITIPPELSIVNASTSIFLNNNFMGLQTASLNLPNLTISINFVVSYNSTIGISMFLMNPIYTCQTNSFGIYQYIQNYAIEYQNKNIFGIISDPASFSYFSIVLGNYTTTGNNNMFRFILIPSISHQINCIATIVFPSQIIFNNNISCLLNSCTNLIIINVTSINITIPYVMLANQSYQIKINNIKNPRSLKPTSSLTFLTSYQANLINIGLYSIIVPSPNILTIAYSTGSMNYYSSSSPINITLTSLTNTLISTDCFYVTFSTPFYFRNNLTISCQQNIWNCSAYSSGIKICLNSGMNFTSNSNINFNIIGYSTGKNSTGTITFYSIDQSNYYIDQSIIPLDFTLSCGSTSTCQICSLSNTAYCFACYNDNTISAYVYIINNICTNNCSNVSVYYYSLQNQCLSCISPCLTCSNATVCLSCLSYYYFYTNDSICRSSCNTNQGFYVQNYTINQDSISQCIACNIICLTCTDFSRCIICLDNSLIAQDGQCVKNCSIGYYNLSNICMSCDSSCFNCSGPSSFDCFFCKNSSFYLTTGGQCVSKCPYGTVLNTIINLCNCSSNCSQCSIFQTNCISCTSGYYLYSNVCINACPNSTFANGSSCVPCVAGCSLCNSQSCLQCFTNYYLYNNSCYTDCTVIGNQYQNDIINFVCVKCPTGCNTCNSSNISICYTCLTSYLLNLGTCELQCLSTNTCNSTNCGSGQYFNGVACVDTPSKSSLLIMISYGTLGFICITFSLISKYLAKQTFLPGSLMSMFSVLQVLAYLTLLGLMKKQLKNTLTNSGMYCVVASVILNYILNILHVIVYKKYILIDVYFDRNKRTLRQRAVNIFLLVFSTLTNFRFYQITFSSLCNMKLFHTQLLNISKLTPLNILNYINIGVSIIAITGSILICADNNIHSNQFLLGVLCIVIIVITIISTLLAFIKDNDFFKKDPEGREKQTHETQQYFQQGEKYQFNKSKISSKNMKKSINQTLEKIRQIEDDGSDIPIEKKEKSVIDPLHTFIDPNLVIKDDNKNIIFYQNDQEVQIHQRKNKKRKVNNSKISIKQEKIKKNESLEILTKNLEQKSQSNTIINQLDDESQGVPSNIHNNQLKSQNIEAIQDQIIDKHTIKNSRLNLDKNQSNDPSLIVIKSKVTHKNEDSQNQLLISDKSSQHSTIKKFESIDINFVQKFYQRPVIEFNEPQVQYNQISPSYYNIENQRYFDTNKTIDLIKTPENQQQKQQQEDQKIPKISKKINNDQKKSNSQFKKKELSLKHQQSIK